MGARRKVAQLPIVVNDLLVQRFWSKVRRLEGNDACWLWTGAWRGNGYGAIKVDGYVMDSHVVSWRIAHGGVVVPDGNLIAHRCDVRPCVRPEHLFLATPSENMVDARDKGRLDESRNRGEKQHFAVLTEEIVRKARGLRDSGMSGRKIAVELNVPYSAVAPMLAGKTWAHVV